ncbi:trancriptional regulator, PopR-like protein [Renibacterium salmoninarum ATCC 33209]|uniref:Trancriptional regulator, PopR-like protein n=1 Tax=Renibacterium salmoninarum (strain ATCC 33209 / DSM 20767 / JCM 11484 / NBRC 15589 / NCIMB 2235) TaxID=288705 RepID=A9WMM4_RENSM|nr:helix-turn-helix domain-containing protein [Renibacterium salmoninarum]ABY23385.1 trancriptional regulator, PopR-like protein [Renibacterium salmoninarum ATCC 33209]
MAEPLLRSVHGKILRRARQRQGKTLGEVAQTAGISMQYLSEIERGRKEPSSEILAAVCRALGWSLLNLTSAAQRQYLTIGALGSEVHKFNEFSDSVPGLSSAPLRLNSHRRRSRLKIRFSSAC